MILTLNSDNIDFCGEVEQMVQMIVFEKRVLSGVGYKYEKGGMELGGKRKERVDKGKEKREGGGGREEMNGYREKERVAHLERKRRKEMGLL